MPLRSAAAASGLPLLTHSQAVTQQPQLMLGSVPQVDPGSEVGVSTSFATFKCV